jgi:hypothetical protein
LKSILNRLEVLNKALAEQSEIVIKRKKSVERSKKKLEREESNYYEIQQQRDVALVESWGDTPDWKVLLDGGESYGMLIFQLGTEAVMSLGLHLSGINLDTKQRGLYFSFESNSSHELKTVQSGIEFILPYITANESGKRIISVGHPNEQDYAIALEIDKEESNFCLLKLRYQREECRESFGSLYDALSYVQSRFSHFEYIEPGKDLIEARN